MRRINIIPEDKAKNKRRLKKLSNLRHKKKCLEDRKRKKRKAKSILIKREILPIKCIPNFKKNKKSLKEAIDSPTELNLDSNTENSLLFFRKIRNKKRIISYKKNRIVKISFKNLKSIDYGSISIIRAIADDFLTKNIILEGILPVNSECKKVIIESGLLDNSYTPDGRRFPKSKMSNMIILEKGRGVLSRENNIKISNSIKFAVKHLTNELKQCIAIKELLLEVCGNAIEWGETNSKQWLLGVKYEEKSVIFTFTDVGKGILDTIHRKFMTKTTELLKSNKDILQSAFEKKYNSKSQEENRNKGLPFVKKTFDDNIILNLKVLTNNVYLDFDNISKSNTFAQTEFEGTFYQWTITKESIIN